MNLELVAEMESGGDSWAPESGLEWRALQLYLSEQVGGAQDLLQQIADYEASTYPVGNIRIGQPGRHFDESLTVSIVDKDGEVLLSAAAQVEDIPEEPECEHPDGHVWESEWCRGEGPEIRGEYLCKRCGLHRMWSRGGRWDKDEYLNAEQYDDKYNFFGEW